MVLMPEPVLLVSVYPALSGWSITVQTDKSYYHIGDEIYVSGNLTFNGWPTQSVQVGISVKSWSSGTSYYFGTAATNNDGGYGSDFTLGTNAELGAYTVTASAEGYTNQTTFLVTDAIYVKASGNLEPSNAPISKNGDVYTVTDNVSANSTSGIVIERNNTVLEGAGFALNGKNLADSNGSTWPVLTT